MAEYSGGVKCNCGHISLITVDVEHHASKHVIVNCNGCKQSSKFIAKSIPEFQVKFTRIDDK